MRTIGLLFLVWSFTLPVFGAGLNRVFGIDLWSDSKLWDDDIERVASRLKMDSRGAGETGFYKREYGKDRKVLGTRAYMLQLYPSGNKPGRVVIAFANKPDMANEIAADTNADPGSGEVQLKLETEYRRQLIEDRKMVTETLTQRIGSPTAEDNSSTTWIWSGHSLALADTGDSLVLRIEPSDSRGGQDRAGLGSLRSNVEKNSNGDVILSGIPAISQGARNYCVPASWEKYLRYCGIRDINVYDLAQAGGATIGGAQFVRFAAQVAPELEERGLQVGFVDGDPSNIQHVKSYIDRGLPLMWAMDAQLLGEWALRSVRRDKALPREKFMPTEGALPMPHALLVVGYNMRNKEIALSDSTDLGSNLDMIWIHADEAAHVSIPTSSNKSEMVVLEKGGGGGGSAGSGERNTPTVPYSDRKWY